MRRRLLNNKKGVEIAVNYIVMMVLGLATLSLGFVIVKAFFVGGDKSITLTNDQLNAKVSDLLCDSNDIICFSDNNQLIHRNEYAFVGLHVKNINDQGITVDVSIDPPSTKLYAQDGSTIIDPNAISQVNIVPIDTQLNIAAKQTEKLGFGLYASKTAPLGTYSFLVTVTDASGANLFGTKKDRIDIQIH